MFEVGRNLLVLAKGEEQRASRHAAGMLAYLAKFVALNKEREPEEVRLEVASMFRWSAAYAQRKIDLAVALTTRLPLTLEKFQDGRIDEYKARRVADATRSLTDEQAGQVEAEVVEMAEGLTVGQLNYRLRRAISRVDPEGVALRAKLAHEARRVRHAALDDGAGVVRVKGDVELTRVAFDRVQMIASQLRAAGDTRTLDQAMADVALDCLTGKAFDTVPTQTSKTVPRRLRMASRGDQDASPSMVIPRTRWRWSHRRMRRGHGVTPTRALATELTSTATRSTHWWRFSLGHRERDDDANLAA